MHLRRFLGRLLIPILDKNKINISSSEYALLNTSY